MHTAWFHFYEVQEQSKLMDDGRNQGSDCSTKELDGLPKSSVS